MLSPEPERKPVTAIVISVVVLAAIAVAVIFLNPRKTAELSVTNVELYSPHTEYNAMAGGIHVLNMTPQAEDNLYVVATVHLQNKLRLPLFPTSWVATMTAVDGTETESTFISPTDFPRLTQAFPALAPMLTSAISNDAKADPGQSLDGKILLLFANKKDDDWRNKKSAALTLSLAHQNPQTVALP